MLETTFATTFTPGINIKGSVAGASWVYLLPSLAVECTLCIDPPSTAALATFSSLSEQIQVACKDEAQAQMVAAAAAYSGVTNVTSVVDDELRVLPDQSVDLIVVGARHSERWSRSRRVLLRALKRVLKPDGMVYFESRGPMTRFYADALRKNLVGDPHQPRVFWLTPARGELHTAVPVGDREMIRHFLKRRLYSSMIDPHMVNVAKQLFTKPRQKTADLTVVNPPSLPRSNKSVRQLARKYVIRSGVRLLGLMKDTEWFTHKYGLMFRRYGVLIGGQPQAGVDAPPVYLRQIAESAGLDIRDCRWSLSAPGEYSSRKVVFQLFGPGSSSLQYIVKMTRDRRYNARLENESYALSLLEERGIAERVGTPKVAFWGHHGGLAIVGETAVEGVPFAERTTLTADCPYVHSAIASLSELSASTVDHDTVTAMEVGDGLQKLYRQFVQIYNPLPAHREFVLEQISTLARSPRPFPLVFQHGDPGTWNVLVTPAGKASFIDWEAAEPQGMPLWDLFYFLRAYSGDVARVRGVQSRLQGFAHLFLSDTPLSELLLTSVKQSCERLGLSDQFIAPLFYTCWMHRALKESTRLVPEKLHNGLYVSLLRLCIEQHGGTALRRLFG